MNPRTEPPDGPKRTYSVALPPPTYNGLALCAGSGGLELGLSLVLPGHRTVCWVERDAYAASSLVARMDDKALDEAPVWSDIVTFDGRPWRGKVDIISAGYPCQPFSASGKRRGAKDPRHLWPHVRRILEETGAQLLFAENVQGHVSLGLETVWRDLQDMGFQVEAEIFSANEVGAPHIRKRLFILAYAQYPFVRHMAEHITAGSKTAFCERGSSTGRPSGGGNMDVIVPDGLGSGQGLFPPDAGDFAAWDTWLAAQPGLQPALVGADDGLANKLDRYRLTGNGVVPVEAAYALATLANAVVRKTA